MPLDPLAPAATPVNPELDAIAYNESRGKYDATGQPTPTGDKAYGRYQFMGQYIPALTKQYLGTEMKPDEFLKNPEAQDKVADARWNDLRKKHNPEEAARVWAGGEGALKTNEKDTVSGESTDDYGKRYTDVHNQLHPQPNTGYAPLPENTKQDLIAQNVDPAKYAENVAKAIEKGGDDYFKAYKSLYATYDRTATAEQHANNAFQLATTGGQPVVKTVLHAGDDFRNSISNSFTDLYANIKEAGAGLEHMVGLTDEKQFKAQTNDILKQKAFDRLQISENGQKDPFSKLPDGSWNWNGMAAGFGGLVGGFGTLAPAIAIGGLVTAATAGADLPFLAAGASAAEAGIIGSLTYGDLASMAGTSLTMGIQGYGSHYEEGLQRGLDNDSAATYGAIGALTYGLVGAIPGGAISKKLFGIEAKELSEPLIKRALDNGGTITKEMLKDYMPELTDGLKNAAKRRLAATGRAVLEEGGITGGVMGTQAALDRIATIQYSQLANKQDKFRDVLDKTAEENFVDIAKQTAVGIGIGSIFGLGKAFRSAAHPTMYGYVEENAKKPENLDKLKAMIADYGDKTGKKDLADKLVGDVDDMAHVANTYGHLVKSPDARYQIFQLGDESKKTAIGSEHAIEQKKALDAPGIDPEIVEKDKAKWDEVIKLNGEKQQLITEFKKQIGDTKQPIDFDAYTKAAKQLDGKIKMAIDATEEAEAEKKPAEPVAEKQPDPFEQKPAESATEPVEPATDLDKLFGTGKAVAPKTVKDVLDVPITMGGTKGFLSMREDGGIDFTTDKGKVHNIANKADAEKTLAKDFDAIGIQPEDVDQFQLRNKMEAEKVTAKAEAEKKALPPVPIESLNGKQVTYKGKKGVLSVDEGGKTSFESENGKVYDISTEQDNRNARDYGIEPIKEKPVEPKYNVSEVSETGATVNGVKYSIKTDEKGNISGISPADKPEQSIKNEKLLAAVESERNKLDYKVGEGATSEQIDSIVKLLAPEEQAAETLIDNIHASNASPEVAEAVNILTASTRTESVKYLTPKQHAAVTDWAIKSLNDLQTLQKEERFKNSAQIKAAIDNLDYITKLADENVETTNPGREGAENGAGTKNNAPETKQENAGLAETDKSNDGAPDKTAPRKTGEGETTTAAQGDKNEADNKGAESNEPVKEDNGNEVGKQGTLFQKQGGKPIEKATVSLIDRTLKKAFPNIKTSYLSGEEFDAKHGEGSGIGVTNPDGTVDINTDKVTAQTQVHEMGHVWTSWAKKFAPELYKRGMELASKETGIHEAIKADGYDLEGNALHEEALARMIGEAGEKEVAGLKEPTGITEKAKAWVGEMWDKLKGYVKNRLGIKDSRFDNLKDLPFNQFAGEIARHLVAGKEISPISSEEVVGIESDGVSAYGIGDSKRYMKVFETSPGSKSIPISDIKIDEDPESPLSEKQKNDIRIAGRLITETSETGSTVSDNVAKDVADTNNFTAFQSKYLALASKNKWTKNAYLKVQKAMLSISSPGTWAYAIAGKDGMFWKAYEALNTGQSLGFRYKEDNLKLIKPLLDFANEGREKTLEHTKGDNLKILFPGNTTVPDDKIAHFEQIKLHGLMQQPRYMELLDKGEGLTVMLSNKNFEERKRVKFTVYKSDFEALENQFTSEQIKLMNGARTATSDAMWKQENPAFRALNGIDIDKFDKYEGELNIQGHEDDVDDFILKSTTIENVAHHKETTPSADAVYLIDDPSESWERGLDQGSKYAGMAVPIRNTDVLMGYARQNMVYLEMEHYINYWNKKKHIISNPEPPVSAVERFLVNNFSTATIGLNPLVDLKHLTTFPLASGYVPLKYTMSSLGDVAESYVSLVKNLDPLNTGKPKNYTPLLQECLKDNYFFLRYKSGVDESQIRLKGDKFSVPMYKEGRLQMVDFADKASAMVFLKTLETATGTGLWSGAKKKVRAEMPHLTEGTPEFTEQVSKLYRDGITASQPSFNSVNRPLYMDGAFDKTRGVLNKTVSMFAGQPFAAFNETIKRGMGMLSDPTPKTRFNFAKSLTNTLIVNALIVSGINLVRQKTIGSDKDKETLAGGTLRAALGSLPVIGPPLEIVYGKVERGAQGYDLNYPATEVVNDMAKTIAHAITGKESQAAKESMRIVPQLLGIPATPFKFGAAAVNEVTK